MAKIVDGIARSTIRFSVEKKEHHLKAHEIVEGKSGNTKNEFMIQAILAMDDRESLEDMIRRVVREELARCSIPAQPQVQQTTIPQQVKAEQPPAPEDEIPSDAMDFMNGLG